MKKLFSPKQKAMIALEAIKGIKEPSQIASLHEAHPVAIGIWKKLLLENAHIVFEDTKKNTLKEKEDLIDRLYKTIGRRDIEMEWLKKKLRIDS